MAPITHLPPSQQMEWTPPCCELRRRSSARYVAETKSKMPTRIALIFLALFSGVVSSAVAQEPATALQPIAATEYFHRIYEGKIAGKYPITMDLKKSGNTLKGSYQYKGKTSQLDLQGTIDSSGIFTMNEFAGMVYSKPNAIFSGTMSGDSMRGVWSVPDGSRKLAFEVHITSEVRLKPKKEALQSAVGTYYLESVSGAVGANGMFDLYKENGVWKSTSSAISGGMREGYENDLSSDERSLLSSTRITVDSVLTVRLVVRDEILLEIPLTENGMLYKMDKPSLSVLDEVLKKLSPSTTYVEEELYLAALQSVDYSKALPVEISSGMLVLSYSPGSGSFLIHIAESCCANNMLVFAKSATRK
jgi:hypothetical protein